MFSSFSKKEPLIHQLYYDLSGSAREFLVKFVAPKCLKGPRNLNDLNLTESTSQNDVGIFLGRDTRNIFYVTKRNVQEDFMARVKKSLHQSRSYIAGETFPGQYTPTRNLVPEPRQRRKAWFFVEADRSSQPVSTHPELISFLKKKKVVLY